MSGRPLDQGFQVGKISCAPAAFRVQGIDGSEGAPHFSGDRKVCFNGSGDDETGCSAVFAFDMKVEGNTRDKTEFLNITSTETSEAAIEKVKEEDFNFINLKNYDPSIWKDYSSIQPLEEMKQFKSVD